MIITLYSPTRYYGILHKMYEAKNYCRFHNRRESFKGLVKIDYERCDKDIELFEIKSEEYYKWLEKD